MRKLESFKCVLVTVMMSAQRAHVRCIHVGSTSKRDVEILSKWRCIWKLRSTSICDVESTSSSTKFQRRFYVDFALHTRWIDVEIRRRNCVEMTLDLKVEIDVDMSTSNQRRIRRNFNVHFTSLLRCIHVGSTSKHDVEIVLNWRWIWKLRSTSICRRRITVGFNNISTLILRWIICCMDRRWNRRLYYCEMTFDLKIEMTSIKLTTFLYHCLSARKLQLEFT